MQPTIVKPLGIAALALLLGAGLAGCQAYPVRPAPPPHAVVHVDPWYPYDYFYYPGVQVYFHIHSGDYWYRDRGRWHRSHQLPPHLWVVPRDRVRIRVDRGEPWRHHQEHVRRYRPRLAPEAYRRPELRDRDRQEREHNRRLHREYRERPQREDRREPRINQAPQALPQRQAREEPRVRPQREARRDAPLRQERAVWWERQARPEAPVRQQRAVRQERQAREEPRVRPQREIRRDAPVRQERAVSQERQAREQPRDRREAEDDREPRESWGRPGRHNRYSDRR